MKKQLMTSLALLALTTPIVAIANIETHTENLTETNIQTKDITANLNRAKKQLLSHTENDHNSKYWNLDFDEVKIVVPNISKIYLNDANLSPDSSGTHDTYRVGIHRDIRYWKEIENSMRNNDGDGIVLNKDTERLYLDYNSGLTPKYFWTVVPEDDSLISIGIEESTTPQDWVFDISELGNYLMGDHQFIGPTEAAVEALFTTYWDAVKPFIIEGDITFIPKGEILEREVTLEIAKDSKNKIEIYAQRYDSSNLPSNLSLFEPKYLIAEDTFKISSLTGGEITAIVVSSVVGIVLIGGTIFWYIKYDKIDNDKKAASKKEKAEPKLKKEKA